MNHCKIHTRFLKEISCNLSLSLLIDKIFEGFFPTVFIYKSRLSD